eukprot:356125-Pyramimonas_sp.AAC.1
MERNVTISGSGQPRQPVSTFISFAIDPLEQIVAPTRRPHTIRYRDMLQPVLNVAQNVLVDNLGCCPET